MRTFPADEEVPLDGVVRGLWRDAVVEKNAAGRDRINRVTYEAAVLEAVREQLRCKEIWVVGANRYRDPDEDLPADFEANRDEYYKALDLPLDADRFINQVQDEMREALGALNGGLKKNPDVRIGPKGGGWITLTPLDAQPDPPTLKAFKAELNTTWPMTGLLDMVKETDLRLRFTDVLKSPTAYETLERSVLQPRLLLCLHGLGTNAGLQRMASLESGVTAKDLAYVRRRARRHTRSRPCAARTEKELRFADLLAHNREPHVREMPVARLVQLRSRTHCPTISSYGYSDVPRASSANGHRAI